MEYNGGYVYRSMNIYFLHLVGSTSPIRMDKSSSIIIPSVALFFKDPFISFIIAVLLGFYLFFEPDVLGNVDNQSKANPPTTPNHILPEWYFMIYHCSLRCFPNKTMGVILVLLLFLLTLF